MFVFIRQGYRDTVSRTAEIINVVVPAEVNVLLRWSVRVMVVAGSLSVSLLSWGSGAFERREQLLLYFRTDVEERDAVIIAVVELVGPPSVFGIRRLGLGQNIVDVN